MATQPLRNEALPSIVAPIAANGSSDTRNTQLLVDAYKGYLLTVKRRSHLTWEKKLLVLNPFIAAYPTLPVDTSSLSDFLATLKPTEMPGKTAKAELSGTTFHTRWTDLKAFYYYLAAVRKIGSKDAISWPDIRPEKDSGLPRILTPDEKQRLVARAKASSFQDYAMVRLMLSAGPRAGEVVSIDDTDVGEETIRVKGKSGVLGTKTRNIPLKPYVRVWLLQLIRQNGPGPVFRDRYGHKMRSDGVTHRIKRLMEEAGITGEKTGAHTLRHTFATEFYRQRQDLVGLAHILGHVGKDGKVNLQTTRIYVTLASEAIKESYDKFEEEELPTPDEQGKLPLDTAVKELAEATA